MVRRLAPLALLAALALAGCGHGTAADLTPAQERARVAFVEAHRDFSDRELAQLCPGLYPRDFLTNTDRYPAAKRKKDDRPQQVTAQDRADAKAAGCDVRP